MCWRSFSFSVGWGVSRAPLITGSKLGLDRETACEPAHRVNWFMEIKADFAENPASDGLCKDGYS